MKNVQLHVNFEVEIATAPFKAMFGSGESTTSEAVTENKVEDISILEQMFG